MFLWILLYPCASATELFPPSKDEGFFLFDLNAGEGELEELENPILNISLIQTHPSVVLKMPCVLFFQVITCN